ncbi:hypothetical protein ACIBP6_20995 [Nonomuraea terrae]|uniref:hypothetical protein n=1 Tax=Nonomuraea terrae TaxID=2530383 RepID=UPI00379C7E3C
MPGAGSLWRERAGPAADELPALVGPVRARLLRALDRPMTMSMPAAGVHLGPSGLTRHRDRRGARG